MIRFFRFLHQTCFLTALLISDVHRTNACTTVVVSGKATADGRPLLWKNRDTWQRQNELVHDDSGRFAYVGVTNAGGSTRVWMGCNTAGFCIENSVSRDLAPKVESGMTNGQLIRLALQTCSTADDFQALLDSTNSVGRKTRGNFGVIDAQGGAKIFEVGPNSYACFDANDPAVAPDGYIVRANFSETAMAREGSATDRDSAYSIERFNRAGELCSRQLDSAPIDLRYLLQAVARDAAGCPQSCFARSITRNNQVAPESLSTSKTLNRRNTVSAVVFHGVRPNESPRLTTMWTLLGEPLFTVAFPSWASQGGIADETNGDSVSELCNLAVKLRNGHYDPDGSHLFTSDLESTTKQLVSVENDLIAEVERRRELWQTSTPKADSLRKLHNVAARRATEAVRALSDRVKAPSTSGQHEPTAIDFAFEDSAGTRLAATTNSAGEFAWNGGFSDSAVVDGVFRIRRNDSSAINRYIDVTPTVRVRGQSITYRGYLVAEIKGWNLKGKTLGEQVRFGFTSQSENNYQTAAMRLQRTADDQVTLTGIAFGDGSGPIATGTTFPAHQDRPVTLVLALDKVKGNPDEGESGGEYQVFYRIDGEPSFHSLGPAGKLRRARNGNEVHLRTAGLLGAEGEYFDIDRIYYTTSNPVDSVGESASP